ncbi:radical SAM/SPASM domain-containing protein [Helicobacter turcicus]|uniref:SPASM domain-containing protein n=1 Tax=Helicobacter turcicus TaxID=2867412 RepID=A0ABS7JLH1_9HELI|nr:radical SAM/SPASM domain-containing protein [Helicobacter turcicus]MBX7490248.1 SPASM domain-containing protein [Helicobacter turcicus]MBX7545173.1 SPASM domain-containing protein [Helicobacter turcicus]
MSKTYKEFEKIFVEITNFCGLHCSFCTPKKEAKKIMPLELFNKISQEISPYTKLCSLHILGDPLSINNLKDYLDSAKDLKLDITTSGFFLNPQNIALLLEYPNVHQINISLTSILYQKQPMLLESYLQKVLELCQKHQAKQSEKFINLRLWNLNSNFKAPKCNATIYETLQKHFNLSSISPLKTRLSYKIHLIGAPFFEWVDTENTIKHTRGFCYGASKQLGILCDGRVVPCCFDTKGEITLGDIKTQNFREILESKRRIDLINGFKNNARIESLCQACKYPNSLKSKDLNQKNIKKESKK